MNGYVSTYFWVENDFVALSFSLYMQVSQRYQFVYKESIILISAAL